MTTSRPYDLLVWGATGFVGRLAAERLTSHGDPEDLRLALGGRDEGRLDALAAELCDETEWDDLPVVVGDATDRERLGEIAARTRVVCSTVGPYARYGTPLVDACVATETDYCDVTGEVTWMRETIDDYHDAAVASDTRIVHACGFDSIPADLGTALVQRHAMERYDTPCDRVRIYLEDARGGVSGGTLASVAELFASASADPTARETMRNPYALAPPDERDGTDTGVQRRPRRDPYRGTWTSPSPMAVVNERVVRRTNGVLGYPWGRRFRCDEVIPTGRGVTGAAIATGVSAGLGLATAGLSVDPIRETLRRGVFPESGEGPSADQRADGRFSVRIRGHGTTDGDSFTVEGLIGAEYDPGYGATARMLAAAVDCLVYGETTGPSGGVLTPASGIGPPLADRLREREITVRVPV